MARAQAVNSSTEALIAHLKLAIEKMRRELYGSRFERGRKLVDQQILDQMELELESAHDSSRYRHRDSVDVQAHRR